MTSLEQQHSARRLEEIAALKSLAEFLRKVSDAPSAYAGDDALVSALRSQGALAKYAAPSTGTTAMSLNHQKKLAAFALGGFDNLDRLRRGAYDAVVAAAARADRGDKQTKAGLTSKLKDLEADKQLLLHDLFLLQRAYDLISALARRYAEAAGAASKAQCARELAELEASLSLRRKPTSGSNVIPFARGA